MSARPFRPFRWIAGGVCSLIVTIWVALMLGLNAPSVRSVPVAPWADGGFGADAPAAAAAPGARLSPEQAPPLRPAHVAGVRVPAAPPASPSTPPRNAAPAVPLDSPSSRPTPLLPLVPALDAVLPPVAPSLPELSSLTGGWQA